MSRLNDASLCLVLYISNFAMAGLQVDLNSRSRMKVVSGAQKDLVYACAGTLLCGINLLNHTESAIPWRFTRNPEPLDLKPLDHLCTEFPNVRGSGHAGCAVRTIGTVVTMESGAHGAPYN